MGILATNRIRVPIMVDSSDVVVGAFFRTESGQLRKVTVVWQDDKGNTVVDYVSKSANFRNRIFGRLQAFANPAKMDKFLQDCGEPLSEKEIQQLRDDNIILDGE